MSSPRPTQSDDLSALRIDRAAPPPRRRGWRTAGLALAVLGLGAGALGAWRVCAGAPLVVPIALAERVTAAAAAPRVLLTGTGYVVTAAHYISLGTRVSGRIEAYLVEEGDRVKAGQPLVRLDARRTRAALREARAKLRETLARARLDERELARTRELLASGIVSRSKLDVDETELALAQAQAEGMRARIAQLEVDLEDSVLRAPVDALVLRKLKEVGEIAVPGGFAGSGDLIRLANLRELRVEIDVNEADLATVHTGGPARITVDAFPDKTYAGTVVKLDPQINRQKGTLRVEVRIEQPDAALRPDMSARVAFLAERPKEHAAAEPVVIAPRAALRRDAAGPFVWTLSRGRLHRQRIEIAGEGEDDIQIGSGLEGGEALVVGERNGLAEDRRAVAETH